MRRLPSALAGARSTLTAIVLRVLDGHPRHDVGIPQRDTPSPAHSERADDDQRDDGDGWEAIDGAHAGAPWWLASWEPFPAERAGGTGALVSSATSGRGAVVVRGCVGASDGRGDAGAAARDG